jgi:hypothetical protein
MLLNLLLLEHFNMEETRLIPMETVIEHLNGSHLSKKQLRIEVLRCSLSLRLLLSVPSAISLDDWVGDLRAWTIDGLIRALGHHLSKDGVLLLCRSDEDVPAHYDHSPSFVPCL